MITKQESYKLLFELQKNGVDVDAIMKKLIASPRVPIEVIQFINNNRLLYATSFYENLRNKNNTKKTRLYIQIMKDDLEEKEIIKSASSFITHAFIFSENLENLDKVKFFKSIHLDKLVEAIGNYIKDSNIADIINLFKLIKSDIKVLENKE